VCKAAVHNISIFTGEVSVSFPRAMYSDRYRAISVSPYVVAAVAAAATVFAFTPPPTPVHHGHWQTTAGTAT